MAKQHKRNQRKTNIQLWGNLALVLLIIAVLTVGVGGTWYYQRFLPQAEVDIISSAQAFSVERFNMHYQTISGLEGIDFASPEFSDFLRSSAPEMVLAYKNAERVSALESEVEVEVDSTSWRKATARVIFMRSEADEDTQWERLEYYTLQLVRVGDQWLVDRIKVPVKDDLEAFWRRRGFVVEDDNNTDDDNDNDNDSGDEDEEEDGDTDS